jgi:hypothetical protein
MGVKFSRILSLGQVLGAILIPLLFAISFASDAYANVSKRQASTVDYARVGVVGNSYLTKGVSQQLSDKKTGHVGVTGAIRASTGKDSFDAAIEAEALFGIRSANYRYISLAEAYLGSRTWLKPVDVYVGRKLQNWSELDRYWSLGLWEPRFRWDYLDAQPNGLFGAFAEYKGKDFEITGFASPIFIPEQGAPFEFTNGDCNTSSPWFNCPTSNISLFNQPTSVKYKLELPPIRRLISYPGLALSVRVGGEKGTWARAGYAHKPINQLLLAYEGFLSLATQDLPATIHTRVLKHNLTTIETGYRGTGFSGLLSFMHEHPIRDVTPEAWNTQEATNAIIFGGVATVDLFGKGDGVTRGDFGFMHRRGGNAYDRGPLAGPNSTAFEARYAYENAYNLGIRTPIVESWGKHFHARGRFLLDTAHDGNILIVDLNFTPTRHWLINLGLDMLGSNATTTVDFIARYQRNDRLRGGVYYYF